MIASSTIVSANPGGVKIATFETEKVIHKPKEPVVFTIAFTAIDNHQNKASREYDVQVWVESELNPAVMITSKKLALKPEQVVQAPVYNQPFFTTPEMINAKIQKLKLEWKSPDKNVFGHRYDHRIRLDSGVTRSLRSRHATVAAATKADLRRHAALSARVTAALGTIQPSSVVIGG